MRDFLYRRFPRFTPQTLSPEKGHYLLYMCRLNAPLYSTDFDEFLVFAVFKANPVKYTDPDGRIVIAPVLVFAAKAVGTGLVSAAVNYGAQVALNIATQATSGNKIDMGEVGGAFVGGFLAARCSRELLVSQVMEQIKWCSVEYKRLAALRPVFLLQLPQTP